MLFLAISDDGMMRHPFSFHLRAPSHPADRLCSNRGLNEYLIILHFLDTCVNDHSLIKKKFINVVSTSISKLERYIVNVKVFLLCKNRLQELGNRRMHAMLRTYEYCFIFTMFLTSESTHFHTLLPLTRPESSQFKPSKLPICPSF